MNHKSTMSSFVTRLLFVVGFIALARAGRWCDPHPPIPGGTIRPTGPVRDGGSVVVTCRIGSRSAGSVTCELIFHCSFRYVPFESINHCCVRKADFCIDGKWLPGIRNCDDQDSWQFVDVQAQLPVP